MVQHRRILLNGAVTPVVVDGDELLAGDGRRIPAADAVHLPPVTPTKIICVHLNYRSRVEEFLAKLPSAPTYFHKPVSSLNSHGGAVVRPDRCRGRTGRRGVGARLVLADRAAQPDAARIHDRQGQRLRDAASRQGAWAHLADRVERRAGAPASGGREGRRRTDRRQAGATRPGSRRPRRRARRRNTRADRGIAAPVPARKSVPAAACDIP